MPLHLTMVVVGANAGCAPVPGAVVDIWHANAAGKYSDIASEGTSAKKFLRGLQATDANGQANFTTVFPGWYSGRAVHIHFKVRVFSGSTTTFEFNSQLFFDPATTNAIDATSAYSSRGTPNVANSADNIYGSDGSKLLVALTANGSGGYDGTFVVGPLRAAQRHGHGRRDREQRRRRAQRDGVSPHGQPPPHPARHLDGRRDGQGQGAPVARRHDDRDEDRHRRDLRRARARPRRPEGDGRRHGPARLTMTYTDGAGLVKTVRKTVKIPRKRLT